jgi:hypothetical protein
MTLGNMRANGVRSPDVCCWQCHHTILSADPWPDHAPVPTFGPRIECGRVVRHRGGDREGDGREEGQAEIGPGPAAPASPVRFR